MSAYLMIAAPRSLWGSDTVPEVDLCAVVLSPQDHAGQLVKVRGVVRFGFEESVLTSDCGARVWLDTPVEHGYVDDKLAAGTRAIFGVSFEEFQEWSRIGLLDDDVSLLPWRTVEAEKPVTVVQNKLWHQLMKIGSYCPTAATLIARVDYLPAPGIITPGSRHGFVWQSSGYGHMDAYSVRLVLAEVVTLEARKRCPKR